MGRIIINYDSDKIDADTVIESIAAVIREGKISEGANGVKHYCWGTTFGDGVVVYTLPKRNQTKTDSFRVEFCPKAARRYMKR